MQERFTEKKKGWRKPVEEEPALPEPDAGEPPKPVITDLAEFLKGTRMLVPISVIGIFFMGAVAFLYFAKPFLMPVVLAVLLNFLLKPVVRFLTRLRLPEAVGAIVVMAIFFTIMGMTVSRLVQPATEWAERAPESIRQVDEKIQRLIRPATQLSQAAEKVENITTGAADTPRQKVEVAQSRLTATIFNYASGFLTTAIETIVLLYFLLAAGDLFMQKLVKILPSLQNKKKAVEITNELQQSISVFLFTITLINVCLGALVGFSVMLIGMPNSLLWGTLAALLNFIPYFGPIFGAVILSIAGFVTFDTLTYALLPPLIYLTFHALEANFITPLILGKRLTMNPVVIFISLIFWTWLWGIPGALLSVPMLMMLKIFCEHFKPLAPIGEFLSGVEKQETPTTFREYLHFLQSSKE